MCFKTFDQFQKIYPNLTQKIDKNIYSIPFYESCIDFQTYLSIFREHTHTETSLPELSHIEGNLIVDERLLNPFIAQDFFRKELKDIFSKEKFDSLEDIRKEYDLIINCTNNLLSPKEDNSFWELCILLLYKKIDNTSFNALTLVDGNLFSIYPYVDDLFTVSHVTYTPHIKGYSPSEVLNKTVDLKYVINNMEEKIKFFYKDFSSHFKYVDHFTSIKAKTLNKSDNRFPLMLRQNNIINCFTGKIQGIFSIENYIKNEIANW
jgi:hypothetical protein